ncbi:hypothetical protein [Bradyrhizobium sp. SYSU BS000235]|uniref:hypothetical protein n=1 Tax=Bradyrhizobium sp. SYSU BS000235 TaxID=3411332 RepID=UPI003C7699C0
MTSRKGSRRGFSLTGICVLAASICAGTGIASAQQLAARGEPERGSQAATTSETFDRQAHKPRQQYPYYVDFRARTAASYGHAFVWYGRRTDRMVEVAGLHPRGESTVPYVLGHVLPVPSETGASYGDLDAQYLTSSYRVYLSEADGKRVFAYIKKLQNSSPVWNAVTYNCTAFIGDIAKYMGLKTPYTHLLYPEEWVDNLRKINGNRKVVQLAPERGS